MTVVVEREAMAGADCIAEWCADTEWCELGCAADVVGRKWHPRIVAALLTDGALRLTELGERLGGVANNTLARCLDDLREKGIVERRVVSRQPRHVEYALTERGEGLEPVLAAMAAWG
jgi:DNA-binding HxlR family transcriptional regulator